MYQYTNMGIGLPPACDIDQEKSYTNHPEVFTDLIHVVICNSDKCQNKIKIN